MAISRKIVVAIVLIALCLAALAILASLNIRPAQDTVVPTRESAIPKDAIKMTPQTDAYPPILHTDEWDVPIPLPQSINTAGAEDSPFVIPDGNTLYFFFTPNASVPAEKQILDNVTGIYVSRKENGTWTSATRVILQDPGKLALDGAEFVQDNTMWFASAREGYTGVVLFIAEYKDGKWTDWRYAGDRLNKDYQMGEMCLTPDGNEIYFHSARSGGKGGLDIWVTRKVNDEWQEPENVAAVNTAGNEGWPSITQNENELWFTRTYLGSPAIFRSTKMNGAWSEPQLILSQFAGEPSLDNDGNLYFVHHFFNTNSQMIEADIYVAYQK